MLTALSDLLRTLWITAGELFIAEQDRDAEPSPWAAGTLLDWQDDEADASSPIGLGDAPPDAARLSELWFAVERAGMDAVAELGKLPMRHMADAAGFRPTWLADFQAALMPEPGTSGRAVLAAIRPFIADMATLSIRGDSPLPVASDATLDGASDGNLIVADEAEIQRAIAAMPGEQRKCFKLLCEKAAGLPAGERVKGSQLGSNASNCLNPKSGGAKAGQYYPLGAAGFLTAGHAGFLPTPLGRTLYRRLTATVPAAA